MPYKIKVYPNAPGFGYPFTLKMGLKTKADAKRYLKRHKKRKRIVSGTYIFRIVKYKR
jgi:hypothetical protein